MATETTVSSAKAWAMDQPSTYSPDDAIPNALILSTSTVSGRIEGDQPVIKVPYVDDGAAAFVPEGTEIPESDPGLDEVDVATGKIAQLVRLSREQYLQDRTSGLIMSSVQRAVTNAADAAYLTQAVPASGQITPPAGLLNISGVTTQPDAVTADLDPLIDLVATLEEKGATPTHIVTSPTTWASLRKLKTASASNESLLGAGTEDAQRLLLDLPVLTSRFVPAGTGLVIDSTAVVSAVGQVVVTQSDQVYFTSDSIGVRCTFRFGQNVVRPERLGVFTVTDAAA